MRSIVVLTLIVLPPPLAAGAAGAAGVTVTEDDDVLTPLTAPTAWMMMETGVPFVRPVIVMGELLLPDEINVVPPSIE